MNTEMLRRSWKFPGSGILSPRGLVLMAVVIGAVFTVCEIAGLREHTTIISGTLATPDGSAQSSAILAAIYMLAWFGFVLAVPILLLTAGMLAIIGACVPHRDQRSRQP